MRVLVVEDVPAVAAMIATSLNKEGMSVSCASSAVAAIADGASERPDVALVDLTFGDACGSGLVSRFASQGCRVIVITANKTEELRVMALELGADEYVVKPLVLRELAASVREVHRRTTVDSVVLSEPPLILVDTHSRQLLSADGRLVALSDVQMTLLDMLLDAEGGLVTREAMDNTVLKRRLAADEGNVDKIVMTLRDAVKKLGFSPELIRTAREIGYSIATMGAFVRQVHPDWSRSGTRPVNWSGGTALAR